MGASLDKRTLSSKYGGSVLWLLVATLAQRCRQEYKWPLFLPLPYCFKPLSLWLKLLLGYIKGQCHFPPSFFSISFFGNQTANQGHSKVTTYTVGIIKSLHAQGKVQAQRRHEKALSLYLILNLSTVAVYINHKKKSKKQQSLQKAWGKWPDFQSYCIIIFECPVFNDKSTKHTKKKKKQANRNCPWKIPDGRSINTLQLF